MLKKGLVSIVLVFSVGSIADAKSDLKPSFDEVIYRHIPGVEAELGFGGYKLLTAMIKHEEEIKKLLTYGKPRVFVEVLPSSDELVDITRYTFRVFHQIPDGFFFKEGPLKASLVIDSHTEFRLAYSPITYFTDGVKVEP